MSLGITSPKGKIKKEDLSEITQTNLILQHGSSIEEIDCAYEWVDKVIRLVEINRRKLPEVFSNRFGSSSDTAYKLVFEVLTVSTQFENNKNSAFSFPDLRAINAALYLRESTTMKKLIRTNEACHKIEMKLNKFLHELPTSLKKRGSKSWSRNSAPRAKFQSRLAETGIDIDEGLIVLSPNPYSLNTIATLWMLRERGVKVSALAIRRMASIKRIREELAFSPRRFVSRIFNEVILRGNKKVSPDAASLNNLIKTIGCTESNAIDLAKKMGADILHFNDFNDDVAADKFKQLSANYAIFTGGGVIKKSTLSSFNGGIVHCHPGILPQYKGMDVIQWAILEGSFEQVGSTCQIMSESIDGGKLVDSFTLDPRNYESIRDLRTAVVERKVAFVVDCTIDLVTKCRKPSHPSKEGSQYFLMHKILEDICAEYQKNTVSKMNNTKSFK